VGLGDFLLGALDVLLPFLFFPVAAALGEDALQEFLGRFFSRVLGHQPAFEGGFECAGTVAVEVVLEAAEIAYCGVEAGELGFDFVNDTYLFSRWRYWDELGVKIVTAQAGNCG
jgi:hypothetical protein